MADMEEAFSASNFALNREDKKLWKLYKIGESSCWRADSRKNTHQSLLEKLVVIQQVKKFSAINETKCLNSLFTRAYNCN